MDSFLKNWGEAAYTTAGFFWIALWAFVLGYVISSMIQVFVTEKRMQETMGKEENKGVLLGTFFGFISSSCSFAALASTKSLFKKGASFVSSMAFLLASTNLVIELGIIISIFLGWQFVVGEYVGGILLILISWLLIRLINHKKLIESARNNLKDKEGEDKEQSTDWKKKITSEEGWAKVARQYKMEWAMVWKDVTVGFTIAGIVAVFVPDSFFQTLFINSGNGNTDFSINAKYYGWKMSLFILFLLFTSLIGASLALHYAFDVFGALPDPSQVKITDSEYFKFNYTFYLNLAFLVISAFLVYWSFFKKKEVKYKMSEMAPKSKLLESILKYAALFCYLWLAGGLIIKFLI